MVRWSRGGRAGDRERRGAGAGLDPSRAGFARHLVASILYAVSLVLLRRQAQVAGPAEVALFTMLVIAVLMTPRAPFVSGWPAVQQWPSIVIAAALGSLSALLLAWAYARAEAQIWHRSNIPPSSGRRAWAMRCSASMCRPSHWSGRRSSSRVRGGGAPTCAGAAKRGRIMSITLRAAEPADTATILGFVRELAAFEREPDASSPPSRCSPRRCSARARRPRPSSPSVTGRRSALPVLRQFLDLDGRQVCIWKTSTSRPPRVGRGGQGVADPSGGHRAGSGWARFEWSVLDWNTPAVEFYRAMGRRRWTNGPCSGFR